MSRQLSIVALPTPEVKQWVKNIEARVSMCNWDPLLGLLVGHPKADAIGRASGKIRPAKCLCALSSARPDLIFCCSPDPALTGIMMARTIEGIQDAGVIACAKHYIANEQEHFRQGPESTGFGFTINDSLSSNVDDTTLHETYLWYVTLHMPAIHGMT